MQTSDDMQLLREFAASQSEEAFATLVSRYINLVYSAALRQAANPHDAEEIAQAVFLVLARKASALRPGVVLSGWLYQTARLTAANFIRGNFRRQTREQEAYMESTANEPDAASWTQIAPLLDEAMARLNEKDRNAVVLRYFEEKDMSAIAAALGSSEDAAKMRLSRALDKLREYFVKRGIPISSAGLAAVISDFSVQAAPAGLAASVTTGICGATVAASTLTLAKGTLTMMTWTKINIGIAAVAIAAVGYQWHEASIANQRAADFEQQLGRQTELYQQQQNALKQLQDRNAELTQQVESAPPPTASVPALHSAAGKSDQSPGAVPSKGLLAQMLKDPAMKKAMRDQQEWMIKKQYASLIKQLNLSPEQSDQFYSILLDQQASAMSNSMDLISGGDKAANATKATQAATALADSQIQALLGDDGFAQYKAFQDALPDKMLLDQMTPEFADNPLTPDQQQQLLQIMRTERENASHLPGQADPQSNPADIAGTMDRAMQQEQQANQQVLQEAAAFLSPPQLQSLGTAQSNLFNMQKAGAAMAQSMFGSASNGNQPAQ